MGISIIIPAYDEEKTIADAIRAYSGLPVSEIIVVCDGNDRTARIARALEGSIRPRLVVCESPVRMGKGGAIMKGMGIAKGEIVGFVDADVSLSPDDYWKAFEALLGDRGCCMAICRRNGKGATREAPFMRLLLSRVFNAMTDIMLGTGVLDAQCGAKAIRKGNFGIIRGNITERGWAFDVDLILQMKKTGRIIEVPVHWKDMEESGLNMVSVPPVMFFSLLCLLVRERALPAFRNVFL